MSMTFRYAWLHAANNVKCVIAQPFVTGIPAKDRKTAALAFELVLCVDCVSSAVFYDFTIASICLHCGSYQGAVELFMCRLPPVTVEGIAQL